MRVERTRGVRSRALASDTFARGLEAWTSNPAVARVLPRAGMTRDALGAPESSRGTRCGASSPARPRALLEFSEGDQPSECFHSAALLLCPLRTPPRAPRQAERARDVRRSRLWPSLDARDRAGVAHGATLDSPSLFETTARVTAVSFGSARQDDTRVNRKRARASSSPERPHATTASAPSRVTRDPSPSRRDATARAEPSSPRNGSETALRPRVRPRPGGARSRCSASTSPRLRRRESGSRVRPTTCPR